MTVITGTDGGDTLTGGADNDHISGLGGDDLLDGGKGNDLVEGGEGDDTLIGGFGNDTLIGGAGVDTLSYAGLHRGVFVDLYGGQAHGLAGAGAGALGISSVEQIENVLGSTKADVLAGDRFDNLLDGGAGDDRMEGDNGDDTLIGGAGSDTAMYAGSSVGVRVDLSLTGPQNTGGEGTDTLTSIENLFGSLENDQLKGDDGKNAIDGFDGADTLIGGGGRDVLTGGFSNDGDTFRYLALTDSIGKGADLITDLGLFDVIDLKAIDADVTQDGDQAFVLVEHFDKHAGELMLSYDAAKDMTTLTVDVDGDRRADMTIHIAGDHAGFGTFVL